MNYYFHDEAVSELIQAIDYYEDCELGLGKRFSEEIYATIKRVCDFPLAWEKLDSKTHRCLTHKLPYAVLYRISENHIRIMAIMNLHRKPGYWLTRK